MPTQDTSPDEAYVLNNPHARPARKSQHARRIEARQKQAQALQLRLAERTLDEIAEALGYANRSGAQAAIDAAMKATVREAAEDVRQMYLTRLYAMLRTFWPMMRNGDYKAADVCLRVLERMAKYLGLDAPLEINVRSLVLELSQQAGLPPEAQTEAIREFEALLRSHGRQTTPALPAPQVP